MHKRKRIIDANIAVHTAAADRYREEPHYRPENRRRVRDIVASVQRMTEGKRLLDLGCGMGFIIDIAREFFATSRGVDVTPAMLARVSTSAQDCDIQVLESPVETLTFEPDSFDVCTAYALLHHLNDLGSALKEASRVLRPGGMIYTDLDPNASFWRAIKSLDPLRTYPESIRREIDALRSKDQEIAEKFGLDLTTVRLAEHWMHLDNGFEAVKLEDTFSRAGFGSVQIIYHWFAGEVFLIHDPADSEKVGVIRHYLQQIQPLSCHLYKYIGVIAIKQ